MTKEIYPDSAGAIEALEQDGELGRDRDRLAPPPQLPNVWIYDGGAYDLTDFIQKHPGGDFFIGRTKNRDITTIVNIFHRNPDKVKQIIKQYALDRPAIPEDIHPTYTAPPFLFRAGFNGWRDTPKFNFSRPDRLLHQIKQQLSQPEIERQIRQMDRLFDTVTILIFIVYILIQWLRLNFTPYMPGYLFVPLMVMLRISLSGAGHYLIHRPQVGLTKVCAHIFDLSYVPMTLVVTDGHCLMHHPFTQSDVDIKRNVFTGMLELPRYYRIPIHTIHKFGHVVTGMLIRTTEIITLTVKIGVQDIYGTWQRAIPHYCGSLAMRLMTIGELVLFWSHGDLGVWVAQFIFTLWLGTLTIVASHDFENLSGVDLQKLEYQDWSVSQIENSYDLTMIGSKYIDCFLSAGLSPHRVHHLLPYQRSGFANIFSEEIVRSTSEEFNVPWLPPQNFFIDRLPTIANHYLLSPSRLAREQKFGLIKEHLHPQALKITINYLYQGFIGIGSI